MGQQTNNQRNVNQLGGATGGSPGGMKPMGASTPTAPGSGNSIPTPGNLPGTFLNNNLGDFQMNSLMGRGVNNLDPRLVLPSGPIEQSFQNTALDPGVLGLQRSIAQGQIPDAILQQFQDQQAFQNAQLAEQFRGARFGSDFANSVTRSNNQSLNALMADTIRQSQGVTQFVQAPALQGEANRIFGAREAQFRDFGLANQLNPGVLGLLQMLGVGGGTTFGSGSNQQYQPLGGVIGGALKPPSLGGG